MIGPLILGIQVTIGRWALFSSTFDQIASVFGDVHAKCLVHTLNRLFQDQGPILHDDSSTARFFGDEEDYCFGRVVGNGLCRVREEAQLRLYIVVEEKRGTRNMSNRVPLPTTISHLRLLFTAGRQLGELCCRSPKSRLSYAS